MAGKRPKAVSQVLASPRSLLASLKQDADHLRRQEHVLQKHLPEPLRSRCRLAGIRGRGELLLLVETPAVASQLRFLGETLCRAVTDRHGIEPVRLRVRIEPARRTAGPASMRKRELSAQAAEHLTAAARHQTDERLQRALRSLASRAGRRDQS